MEIKPAYYAVIPASVRYAQIPGDAKLLYGEISALANKDGYSWASNRYFAELYEVDDRTIRRWLQFLQKIECIRIEIVGYNRHIFLCEGGQKCPGGRTKMSGGADKNVHNNNTSNNTSNTLSISLSEIEEEEEIEYISSIEEFRFFTNEGITREKYPWKNYESVTIDCWLHYEEKGKKIKKSSAQLILNRWILGGDPKKREEEKKNYEDSIRRAKNSPKKENLENIQEEEEKKEMLRIADEFLEKNPERIGEIREIAYSRAITLAKGNENIANTLSKSIFRKVAYELSEREKVLTK